MIVIYNKCELCSAPENLSVGDTIIVNNIVYQIFSKTWDSDNKELYCKVELYEEEPKTNACDILKKLYDSDTFETSGMNTNMISQNQRITILMAILTSFIKEDYLKDKGRIYKSIIINKWSDKHIQWSDIFYDDPPLSVDNIKLIIKRSKALLRINKISEKLWPKLLK